MEESRSEPGRRHHRSRRHRRNIKKIAENALFLVVIGVLLALAVVTLSSSRPSPDPQQVGERPLFNTQ
jgi:hypothetical protein